MQVDQSGRDEQSSRVNHLYFVRQSSGGGGDFSAHNEQVADRIDTVCRVDHAAVLDQECAHVATSLWPLPPEQRNNTAMRTARPLVTCSRITDRSLSAISLSISTPRLIGPGCMMRTSGLVRAKRSLFRPNS